MGSHILSEQMEYLVSVTGYPEITLAGMLKQEYTPTEILQAVREVRQEIAEKDRLLGANAKQKKTIQFIQEKLDGIAHATTSPAILKWVASEKKYWRTQYARL